jgi:hypothetical protein
MNLTKIAGAILPELNERTLKIEGKALRLYDNDGRLRPAVVEALALLKSREKHLAKVRKDLEAKVLADLQAGVGVAPGNHTLELGTKTKTSCSWKGVALDLADDLGLDEGELEDLAVDNGHKTSAEVDCLVIDGRKQ